MPWKYSDEYYREYTRTAWNESAEPYSELMRVMAPFRTDLVRLAAPQPGEAVLDLGTGPGEPAMTIAGLVGARGRVLGVDLSERMIALAERRARELGIENAGFRAMDCSQLDLPAEMFDVAVSSFGFQIFTDPEQAAREMRRVLKPRGRVAISIWSTGDRVPFLDVLIAPMLRHAEPDETGYIPTPYETGGPGEMVRFLAAAGFQSVQERRVTHTMEFASPEAYLDGLLRGTPIGHSLSEESLEVREEVLAATKSGLEAWRTPQGISLPAEAVLVSARK
ncbi:MAG: methyltransferase domain-containing protein [Thermoplasmata archaeon]|nr:methyltransferase domain-containing protein [Thermoplasmata archaeon]